MTTATQTSTRLDDFTVQLDGGALSDLFFNFDLPNYKAFCAEEGEIGGDDEREAIAEDADLFVSCLGVYAFPKDAEIRKALVYALADDFMKRR